MKYLPTIIEYVKSNSITTGIALTLFIVTAMFPPWGAFHHETGILVENFGSRFILDQPYSEANIIYSRLLYYWLVIALAYVFIAYVKHIIICKKR